MDFSENGIYLCISCKAPLSSSKDLENHKQPIKSLEHSSHIAILKYPKLCDNLLSSKKVYLCTKPGPFQCCAIIDLHCKKCNTQLGFIPVSAPAKSNELRDKIILEEAQIEYSEIRIRSTSSGIKTPRTKERESLVSVMSTKKRSMFMSSLEENIEYMNQAIKKCQGKYEVMLQFYKTLTKRLRAIEKHNGTLITILQNIEVLIMTKKRRGKLSVHSKAGNNESPKEKIYSVYKPPLKEIPEISDDEDRKNMKSLKKRKYDDVERDSNGHLLKYTKKNGE